MASEVEIIPPTKKKNAQKKMGRPNNYRFQIGEDICDLLAQGISLNEICNSGKYPEMPCLTAVYNWLRTEDDFAQNYARAKSDSADTLAAKIMDVVENATPETVNVDRLKVDAFKWIAAKLKPRSYGERVQAELTGKDGGPIQTQSVMLNAADLEPEARELLRQSLLSLRTQDE